MCHFFTSPAFAQKAKPCIPKMYMLTLRHEVSGCDLTKSNKDNTILLTFSLYSGVWIAEIIYIDSVVVLKLPIPLKVFTEFTITSPMSGGGGRQVENLLTVFWNVPGTVAGFPTYGWLTQQQC